MRGAHRLNLILYTEKTCESLAFLYTVQHQLNIREHWKVHNVTVVTKH